MSKPFSGSRPSAEFPRPRKLRRLRPQSRWLVRETGWQPDRQNHFATILALSNGTIGSRSILEEAPQHATPGTFLAGVFDAAGSIVDDIVNLPNFFELRLFVDAQRLSPDGLRVAAHDRVLDMRRGVLARRTVFLGGLQGRYELRTERFVSRSCPELAVLRAWITSLDGDAELLVAGDFDLGAYNTEGDWEGRKRHYGVEEAATGKESSWLQVRTPESSIGVGMAWTTLVNGRPVAKPLNVALRRRRTVSITRIVHAASSVDLPGMRLRRHCDRGLRSALRRGVPGLLADHERAWDRLWDTADVGIAGAPKLEHAARFSIYHLLAAGRGSGTPAGIAAKSLTGEGYRGHSFWDTEIYSLPFYSFVRPEMARQLVRYRLDRLGTAKRSAAARGFRGALFPWESGRTGVDVTPYFPLADGSLYLFDTGKYQHHITADVAYGLVTYWTVTGDDSVMGAGGLDLLAETARFWASRVELDRRTGTYAIRGTMGPDEYHPDVDNSVYTNFLARWNLECAADLIARLASRDPVKGELLFARLRLTGAELAEWRWIAARIAKTNPGKSGIMEQFDGYFKLQDVPITKRNEHGMPAWPKGVKEDDAKKTQLNKQADVVLTMLMFPDRFTAEQKRRNFDYYDRRTLHISTLSACMTALAGLEFGIPKYAMRYFTPSLVTDLNDVQGTTDKGIHMASCGGNWQALVRGFGGAAIRAGTLSISPRVPQAWKSLRYSLRWQGSLLRVAATPGSVTIRNEGKAPLDLLVCGRPVRLKPGRRLFPLV